MSKDRIGNLHRTRAQAFLHKHDTFLYKRLRTRYGGTNWVHTLPLLGEMTTRERNEYEHFRYEEER